ncbi:hypothetical protein GEMRC1_011729 [Eukaryota sp. GEM-RC1]
MRISSQLHPLPEVQPFLLSTKLEQKQAKEEAKKQDEQDAQDLLDQQAVRLPPLKQPRRNIKHGQPHTTTPAAQDEEEEKDDLSWISEEYDVLFTTLAGASSYRNQGIFKPQLLIIDEACQSTEPELVAPLRICNEFTSIVIVGDHKQLPPVVFSQNSGLSKSLMERLIDQSDLTHHFDRERYTLLNPQYRQFSELWAFSNSMFYSDQIDIVEPITGEQLTCA